MAALEARHLSDLTFSEVSRGLRALSSTYVERRHTIPKGGVLSGAGKRAAFALLYGPLHYLLVRRIVHALPGSTDDVSTVVDLGCGTGAAGAAWAEACEGLRTVTGIDRHPWAIQETAWTYRQFGLPGQTRRANIADVSLPRDGAAIIAAFTMNELPPAGRDALLVKLLDSTSRAGSRSSSAGRRLLIVEPLAGVVSGWWKKWRPRFEAAGGRADEWRIPLERPPIIAKLDRAVGLDHRELTGRTLWLPSPAGDSTASS